MLPAIQRDLVWDTEQIERLFDSLMRDYPIGSFLFWYVEKERSKDFQFYEFIRNFHQRTNKRIKKADISGEDDIIAILDGQQRLTALYIGLRGTYAYKLPRKFYNNPQAYPERKLYLNLVNKSKKTDLKYDFRFLTNEEAQENDEDHFWFRVGNILNFKEQYEVNNYLIENDLLQIDKEKSIFANKTLFKLYEVIHQSKVINYFLEKSKELDKVLNIFIRVNSGGTSLSYSDLLLSIASTQWKDKDAREEIMDLVDKINDIGNGFNFNKDFVLKSCLILSDFKNIAFKVDNFKKQNMLTIEENWDNISKALISAIELLSSYGYDRSSLAANNLVIPIAYYLLKKGVPNDFPLKFKYADDRKKLHKWLNICQLKRTFGGQSDNVLRSMREVLLKNHSSFPLEEIVQKLKGTSKSLVFDEDEIENLLFYHYGQPYTFSTLALLYPTLDFKNQFHIDHIFPKSFFTRPKLTKRGIEDINFYMDNFNYLANLQLLEGPINEEKSNIDFKEWLELDYPNKEERKDYMKKHFIPDVDLDFENFKEFIIKREEILLNEFKSILKL